ncbi:hypothetical protein HZS_6019 [Henneguya salminicola]|nr:hypothetical protein HZS_6019 [Henneguya salminicola]
MIIGKEEVPVYFSASPSMFVSKGRLNDINAIVDLINNTNSGIIRMCAMEISNLLGQYRFCIKESFYGTTNSYPYNGREKRSALPKNEEKSTVFTYKLISIPDREIPIPHARLFHTKLCIGAGKAWLGTNNFTPDYFHKVAGIGCTISGTTPGGVSMIETLTNVFDRYYNSSYASFLEI